MKNIDKRIADFYLAFDINEMNGFKKELKHRYMKLVFDSDWLTECSADSISSLIRINLVYRYVDMTTLVSKMTPKYDKI